MQVKEGKNLEELARVLLKEPSIEVLLILNDEGPKTENQLIQYIEDEMPDEIKLALGKLRDFELIDHNGSTIWITSYGESLVKKLRKLEGSNDKKEESA